MNSADIAASTERLMNWVDYYLHCEIDDEYQHDKPERAREQLQAALREELVLAHARGLIASAAMTEQAVTVGRADSAAG